MADLYEWINPKTNKHSPMISKATYDLIKENSEVRLCYYFFSGRTEGEEPAPDGHGSFYHMILLSFCSCALNTKPYSLLYSNQGVTPYSSV